MTFEQWCKELAAVVGPALFTINGEFRLRMSMDLESFYALQSLSQEAVRDEALEPLTDDERNDAIEDFRKAVTYFRLTGKIPQGYSQATFIERVGDFALRYLRAALKREPNAEGK